MWIIDIKRSDAFHDDRTDGHVAMTSSPSMGTRRAQPAFTAVAPLADDLVES